MASIPTASLRRSSTRAWCASSAAIPSAIIYGTTNAFLEKFGLRSTRDLPDLEQFAPDEQSRQFIRERLSGRSIQSTLEEQAEDLDKERELLDTDVEDVEAVEDLDTLVVDETSEDLHDEE